MLLGESHWYPPGDLDSELFASSGYQTLLLHTTQYTAEKLREWTTGLSKEEAKKETEKIARSPSLIFSPEDRASQASDFYRDFLKLPQLDIGQMIEFIDSKMAKSYSWYIAHNWYQASNPKDDRYVWDIRLYPGDTFEQQVKRQKPELCDSLWEAVKEILET